MTAILAVRFDLNGEKRLDEYGSFFSDNCQVSKKFVIWDNALSE